MLNILLAAVLLICAYLVYKHYILIKFICEIIISDIQWLIYKMSKPKMTLNNGIYTMNFFINDSEYILNLNESALNKKVTVEKILALSGSLNVTKYILQLAGPNLDFFGNKPTPASIGLEKLNVWKNKVLFSFSTHDEIIF